VTRREQGRRERGAKKREEEGEEHGSSLGEKTLRDTE